MTTSVPPLPEADSVLSADGTRIGYRRLGQGPGLVLMHGGLQTSWNLLKLAEFLSEDFTVYLPDQRGRGFSGPYGGNYSMAKACEDLGALLDRTGASFLFGLSSGALISLQSALTFPSLRKVALYEPPLSINGSYSMDWIGRYDQELAHGRLGRAFVTVVKGTQSSRLLGAIPRFILDPLFTLAVKNEEQVQGKGEPLRTLIPTMGFDARLVKEMAETVDRFRTLRAKTLLMGGSRSPSYLKIALDGLGTVLPNVQKVIFSGLDHLGPSDEGRPEKVVPELRRFFLESDPPTL